MSESKKITKDELHQAEQARKVDSQIKSSNLITKKWKMFTEFKYGQLKMKSLDKRGMFAC